MADVSSTAETDTGGDNVEFDLGYLFSYNREPVTSFDDKYLKERAEQDVQRLFQQLHAIAKGQSKLPSSVPLPSPVTGLPRQKPVPVTEKPKTKWEEFAERKGIQKHKRERMVWDEQSQSWKPRWGYKRVNDEQQEWVVELKDRDDPTADKFRQKRSDKKLRVLKNKQKQLRNQDRASKKSAYEDAAIPSGIAVDVSKKGGKRGKKRTKEALQVAQVSTASLGRFDAYQQGEPNRKLKDSKRRKFQPSEKDSTRERDLKILERVLRNKK